MDSRSYAVFAAGAYTPAIFLAARDEQEDNTLGFTNGGDDVTKPFSLREVVARLGAVVSRTRGGAGAAEGGCPWSADLELDEPARRVWRAGKPIRLTPSEFQFLRSLLLNAERVVHKQQILVHEWQDDFVGDATVIETYINCPRKKVDLYEPRLKPTVRGFGFSPISRRARTDVEKY